MDVQTVLLQNSWFDLFVLGMSQCSKVLSLNSLLANLNLKFQANLSSSGRMREKKCAFINQQLFTLQSFITECEKWKISQAEYAYLKLISLFDPGIFLNTISLIRFVHIFYSSNRLTKLQLLCSISEFRE